MAENHAITDAARLLGETLKLAQMGVEADGEVIHYLIACNARTLTQYAILRLAARQQATLPILQELLKNLPGLDSETNIYRRVLSAQFACDETNSFDLKTIIAHWSKMSKTEADLFLSFYPEDLQPAVRVMLDPTLVALHPNPLDVNAELQRTIRHYRIYRTNSLVAWTQRNGQAEWEDAHDHQRLTTDITPLMELVKNEPLPLSWDSVQQACATYQKIENPVGRILDTSAVGFVASDFKVCQVRTEREATRACLALIIFEREKRGLPATLSDLVGEKILTSVPNDPFCGEPLHYSREKREVWSVSENGVDDHGTNNQSRWYDLDAVWQIPELN